MIKSWSWSRFADYEQCPRRAKFKHVDRLKEPGSKALDRGSEIHDLIASFIKGKLKTLTVPDGEEKDYWKPWLPMLKEYRAAYKKKNHGMTVEDDWAFTRHWVSCKWDDWAKCWVRLRLDLAIPVNKGKLVVVKDWKTGKARDEEKVAYQRQLELFALAALLKYPSAEAVETHLVFLDAGVTHSSELYRRDQLEHLMKVWEKRVAPMFQDEAFAPRASAKCRWCWFGEAKKSAGGPGLCEF